ncbi:CDP-alcohol phosphatidyltransferase family protein [Planomonospora sp. ID67723]|uniref:CDP-alcohol phosphatidyltransferase family protein n=1 Tax=Planomonospora sp. ID67723 TaxID=2738134 RepID=UPI001E569256|nr:CDP-alcohol phosphatidyltransferase family protein [Planomonospora sp. ID67723]
MRAYSLDDVRATCKAKDSWWTVFLVDPVACRITLLVANHTAITPNGLSRFSLILGTASAVWFAAGQLAAGAALFYLSFMVDCMDGKIARLKGTGTVFGLWIDYVGDRIRVVCCSVGLAFGQYAATGELVYILLGTGVAVLDLFRYVNAPQMKRVRDAVRESWPAHEAAAAPGEVSVTRAEVSAVLAEATSLIEASAASRTRGLRGLLGGYRLIGPFLARYRVRTHLVSGIEFHAAVFVVAPLLGSRALLPVSTAAGALLLLNEVYLIYRLWRFTRMPAPAVPAAPAPHDAQRVPA